MSRTHWSRTIAVVAVLCAACGSGTPSGPSPAGPAPGNPGSESDIQLRVDEGYASLASLSPSRRAVVSYSACGSIQNTGQPISYTLELDAIAADGTTYPTLRYPKQETMGTYDARFGCGMTSAFDLSFAHPAAVRYRLRVRYRLTSGGAERTVEGEAPLRQLSAALPARLIVSEFRTRGPNGPTDQFIELFNDSITPKDLSRVIIFGGSRSTFDTTSGVPLPAMTLGPGCHFLLTAAGYSGTVRGDATMPAFLRDDGHIRLSPGGSNEFEGFRYVGMDGSWQYYEGTPLAPFGDANTDRSYALTGQDTNDNGHDFSMISPSRPQNSSSCGW